MPPVPPDGAPGLIPSPRRSLWRTLRWILPLTLLLLIIAGGIGFMVGRAEQERSRQGEIQNIITEQFSLGLLDLEQERYEIARQRFEYIIRLDPSFPGAAERLAEALLGLSDPLATPTLPAATPTPNLAPVQEILDQAKSAYADGDWNATVEQLLALRAKDPEFHTVEVDGLMYAALRNRGIQRISVNQQLEEGIYDLSLAESFAPLDEDATNWRSWAQLYLTANSFFGLNWEQAAFYFELVFRVAPGIRNDVTWKYAQSLQMYALQLAGGGDPCAAEEVLDISLEVLFNEDLAPTATAVRNTCRTATAPPPAPPPSDTPEATPEATATETPIPEE